MTYNALGLQGHRQKKKR